MPYYSRGELEGRKKIADYRDRVESVMTEQREDIELAPYKHQGKKYRVFLTHDDLFKSPVDDYGTFVNGSRTKLEERIANYIGLSRSHSRQLLFFPIMRIDTSPEHGFGMSRYWAAEHTNGKTYWCNWDTPKELRESKMASFPKRLPGHINALPFLDTIDDQYDVYYGVFDKHLWEIFCNLNDSLTFTLAVNKNAVINRIWGNEGAMVSLDALYQELLEPRLSQGVV